VNWTRGAALRNLRSRSGTSQLASECRNANQHRTAIGIAQRGDAFGGGIDLRNAPARVFQHDLPISIQA
jgi:hypothetical protein